MEIDDVIIGRLVSLHGYEYLVWRCPECGERHKALGHSSPRRAICEETGSESLIIGIRRHIRREQERLGRSPDDNIVWRLSEIKEDWRAHLQEALGSTCPICGKLGYPISSDLYDG